MIIMGIDPGIALCGFGIIEKIGSELRHIRHGVITTSASLSLPQRIMLIHDELKQLIVDYAPAVMGVEELFFCKNVKTALVVGQVKGVIILTAAQARIPLLFFTPLQVKQATTSYGRADKNQVQQMVKLLFHLPDIPTPDDAADGLAIAFCCANTTLLL